MFGKAISKLFLLLFAVIMIGQRFMGPQAVMVTVMLMIAGAFVGAGRGAKRREQGKRR